MALGADKIKLFDAVLTAEEWLTFTRSIAKAGESATAAMFYRSLYQLAKVNGDDWLQEECIRGMNSVTIPVASLYREGGATDPNNRPRKEWVHNPEVDIFDPKLDEGAIIDALRGIDFIDLKERRYWFVVQRVFKELNWLSVTMDTKFADWVAYYFQWPWERNNPWRTVDENIRKIPSWEWNNYYGCEQYAALAKILWATFTVKPKISEEDEPIDKQSFYLPNKKKINNG